MYWCFSCYAINQAATVRAFGAAVRFRGRPGCRLTIASSGRSVIPTATEPCLPRQTLGTRRVRSALPALRKVVEEGRDPFLAVAALRAAVAIAGRDELRGWLEQLARCDSFMVRAVAQAALR